MITAISFDVWNTLLKIDIVYHRLAKSIALIRGLNPFDIERTIYDVYKRVKEIKIYVYDDIDIRNFVTRSRAMLAKALNIDQEELSKLIDVTFSSMEIKDLVFDDVIPTLDMLESIGIKMGVIGNTVFWESIYVRELLEKLDLKKYFKIQLYSDELGIFKPDRRIFLEFCKRFNVKPSEAIHVGDNIVEDIGGALSTGMKAILIDRTSKKVSLQLLGIMIISKLEDIVEAIQMLG